MKERLAQYSFSREPLVFSVSARQALEGKQRRNDELIEASGIRQLEDALFHFLTERRRKPFSRAFEHASRRSSPQRCDQEKQPERREILAGLLEGSMNGRHRAENPHEVTDVQGEEAGITLGLVLEKRTGCWICGQVLEAVFRFLSKHQYQLTIDRAAQQEHARRGGFCSLHTWQYENISSPYGVCASYPALVHRMASELDSACWQYGRADQDAYESINQLAASQNTCQVCQVRIEAERNAVHEAAGRVREITSSQAGKLPACCLLISR